MSAPAIAIGIPKRVQGIIFFHAVSPKSLVGGYVKINTEIVEAMRKQKTEVETYPYVGDVGDPARLSRSTSFSPAGPARRKSSCSMPRSSMIKVVKLV
jgi:hypothetical protein